LEYHLGEFLEELRQSITTFNPNGQEKFLFKGVGSNPVGLVEGRSTGPNL
jgi:hypothetical protein